MLGQAKSKRALPLPEWRVTDERTTVASPASALARGAPLLFAACRAHHGQYDAGLIDVDPQTPDGADGPMDFKRRNQETGEWEVFASETRLGVSVAVGN